MKPLPIPVIEDAPEPVVTKEVVEYVCYFNATRHY